MSQRWYDCDHPDQCANLRKEIAANPSSGAKLEARYREIHTVQPK